MCFIITLPHYFSICLKYHKLIYPKVLTLLSNQRLELSGISRIAPVKFSLKVFAQKYQMQYFLFSVHPSNLSLYSPFFSLSPLNSFQFIQIFWTPISKKLNALFQVWTHHSYGKCYHITSLSFMTQVIQSLSVLSPKEPHTVL